MNKYLAIFISVFFALLFVVGTVYASHIATSISYPIPELGNCGSYGECRAYCLEPIHFKACIDWAQKKGVHTKAIPEEDKQQAFKNAKTFLGCEGQDSCQSHCAKRDNFDRCDKFAKDLGLTSGGYMVDPGDAGIRKRADEFLGCKLDKECKNFCDIAENKEKCSDFAREVGLGGGIRQVGPGGCTSQETCQTFCQDPQNKDKCAGFIKTSSDTRGEPPFPYSGKEKPIGGQISDQNPGPGGCTSEKNCDAFCSDPKNEGECNKYQKESGYQWSGPGGCTSAQSCAAYCKSNYKDPECGGGADAGEYEAERQKYEAEFQQMEGQKLQKQQEYDSMQQQYGEKQKEFDTAQQQYGEKQREYDTMQGQEQQKQQEFDSMQGQQQQKQQEYNQMQQMQQQQAPSGVQGVSANRSLLQIIQEMKTLFRN